MKTSAKRMAMCAMTAALCVVLLLLGAVLELGMYACPLLAGLCLVPIGSRFGRKYHIITFAVTSVLCLLLVPNIEENLMFIGLLGWYPILSPKLQKIPRLLGWLVKLIIFNAVVIAIEWLVMTVLVPEVIGGVFLWILLILGNITLLRYDWMLPRLENLMVRIFPK